MERETRFELATPTLARLCSTTELFPHLMSIFYMVRGGCERNRTAVDGFAGHCITTLLRSLNREIKKPRVSRLFKSYGAGNEVRTRDPNLGKVVLYH